MAMSKALLLRNSEPSKGARLGQPEAPEGGERLTLTKSQKLAWQAKDDLILVLEARAKELEMVLACHAIDHYSGKVEVHHPVCERAVLEWRRKLDDDALVRAKKGE